MDVGGGPSTGDSVAANVVRRAFHALPGPLLTVARKALCNNACQAVENACWRSYSLLRGMRGAVGVRWAMPILLEPAHLRQLADTGPGDKVRVLHGLILTLLDRHNEEERRLCLAGEEAEEARKFSQHRFDRHAGQSGKAWLEEASAHPARLEAALSSLAACLPGVWSGSRSEQSLDDVGWKDLLSAVYGLWPMVGERGANDYTAMDVGRLSGVMPIILQQMPRSSFGRKSFALSAKQQGKAATETWKSFGVNSAQSFLALEARLHAAALQVAPEFGKSPEWAQPDAVCSPMVCVALCEYGETEVDHVPMHVLDKPPNDGELQAIRQRMALLSHDGRGSPTDSTGGRCYMSILTEVLAKQRGAKKYAQIKKTTPAVHWRRMENAVRFEMCPKIFWQHCTEVTEITDGIRRIKEAIVEMQAPLRQLIHIADMPMGSPIAIVPVTADSQTAPQSRARWDPKCVITCTLCSKSFLANNKNVHDASVRHLKAVEAKKKEKRAAVAMKVKKKLKKEVTLSVKKHKK